MSSQEFQKDIIDLSVGFTPKSQAHNISTNFRLPT